MASSGSSGRGKALYGGLRGPGPLGFPPRLLELADELRREGVAIGTSELLDAFRALSEVSWTEQEDFREALAATLAKSQEDRRAFELIFDRYFFRAVEREAVERGLTEKRYEGGDKLDFDQLRDRIREAAACDARARASRSPAFRDRRRAEGHAGVVGDGRRAVALAVPR